MASSERDPYEQGLESNEPAPSLQSFEAAEGEHQDTKSNYTRAHDDVRSNLTRNQQDQDLQSNRLVDFKSVALQSDRGIQQDREEKGSNYLRDDRDDDDNEPLTWDDKDFTLPQWKREPYKRPRFPFSTWMRKSGRWEVPERKAAGKASEGLGSGLGPQGRDERLGKDDRDGSRDGSANEARRKM